MSQGYAAAAAAVSSSVEALSPASSTSKLRAAPAKSAGPDASRQHSRGQMARKQTTTNSVASASASHSHTQPPQPGYQAAADQRHSFSSYPSASASSSLRQRHPASSSFSRSYGHPHFHPDYDVEPAPYHDSAAQAGKYRQLRKKRKQKPHAQQPPLLGGLYFSDLIVVAFFFALNLVHTCGLAELMDVAFTGIAYALTRLPIDFWQRWSLSRYPSSPHRQGHFSGRSNVEPDPSRYLASSSARRGTRQTPALLEHGGSGSRAYRYALTQSSASGANTSDDNNDHDESYQLSPFHHLVILLVRFACTSFPHLLPRVLFAEDTIGPLVRWRTGGGAAGIVREFTNEPGLESAGISTSSDPLLHVAGSGSGGGTPRPRTTEHHEPQLSLVASAVPAFRAFWIGADAHIPVDVRRRDPALKHATTLLYLHGGGFSLGSVAFYAEALIRIMAKVARFEQDGGQGSSRCVALEYDLSPSVRFPASLLQCLRCYAHLIEVERIDPASITIAGDSAGANLAMSLLLCLDGQACDEPLMSERDWSKLPMPGQAVLVSPWADLRPSGSLAFAPLREQHLRSRSHATSGRRQRAKDRGYSAATHPKPSVWTEAMASYEWDYVAAEALLHFAQVYAGVLEKPRRVRGPMGWIANLCAILADDPQPQEDGAGAGVGVETGRKRSPANPLSILSRLVTPPTTRLAKAAHAALTEPLLDLGAKRFRAPGRPRADPFQDERLPQHGGLDPLFPRDERQTDAVATTADLYIATWGGSEHDPDADPRWKDPAFRAAVERLDNHVLISPSLGDWSQIRLERGLLVTWGERERLADDIEAWAEKVRKQQQSRDDLPAASDGKHAAPRAATSSLSSSRADAGVGQNDFPAQDGAEPTTRAQSLQERRRAVSSPASGETKLPPSGRPTQVRPQWLCTAVEHGPSGVHAWPFVAMYLAGSELERDKGLDLIARFVANTAGLSSSSDESAYEAATAAATAADDSRRSPLSMNMPARKTSTELLAPRSPLQSHDGLSPVGSLPSDVYDDDDERHYMFNSCSREDSIDWDNQELRDELSLRGVELSGASSPEDGLPLEPMWNACTPTPTTGNSSPVVDRANAAVLSDRATDAAPITSPRVGLGLASAKLAVPDHAEPHGLNASTEGDSAPGGVRSSTDETEEEEWVSDGATTAAAAAKRPGGKRVKTASSSASSSAFSTPRASAPAAFTGGSVETAKTSGSSNSGSGGLRLDPVHLSAPTYQTASFAASLAFPPSVTAAAAAPPSTLRANSVRSLDSLQPDVPTLWGGNALTYGQDTRGRAGASSARPSFSAAVAAAPQIGRLGRSGMTLAEIEALEEALEEAAARAASSSASSSASAAKSFPSVKSTTTPSATPPVKLHRSRDRLSRVLGNAYESDPDLPLDGDDDDDDDDDDEGMHGRDDSDDSDDGFGGARTLASPRYVDDGTLSSSIHHPLSMDPSFYGLSSYATSRPEGLSDIAEEDSQFDASSSFGGGLRSPAGAESEDGLAAGSWEEGTGLAFTPGGREVERLREALQERERRWRVRSGDATNNEDDGDGDEPVPVGRAASEARVGRFPLEDDEEDESDLGLHQEDTDDFSPDHPSVFRSGAGGGDAGSKHGMEGGSMAWGAGAGTGGRKSPTPSINSFSSQKSKEDVWW